MKHPTLYNDFGTILIKFVEFCLHSKTNGKDENGQTKSGNTSKIQHLIKLGITSEEDVQCLCIMQIIKNLDLILSQPLEKQYNYCYTICNNKVKDQFKAINPKGIKFIYLQEPVNSKSISSESEFTHGEMIRDYTYDGEHNYFEKDTLRKILAYELNQLNRNPTEVLVCLANLFLGIKPSDLAKDILNQGIENTFKEILFEIVQKNNLDINEFYSSKKFINFSDKYIKADTKDEKVFAEKIYNLSWRAKNNLKKQISNGYI